MKATWTGDGELEQHRRHPPGEAEPHPLLPLHELHVQGDGGEVRHPLAGVQLLRPDQDQGEPARHRRALRRPHQGERGAGHRQVRPDHAGGDRRVPAAPGGQEGDAATWAASVPATPSTPTRTWAWWWSAPATSSPTATTTSAPPRRCRTPPSSTTTPPSTSWRSSSTRSSPTWSAAASRRSTSSRRWASPSGRCTAGTTPGPYHAYKGFSVFARDVDMAVNSPTWKLVKSPF